MIIAQHLKKSFGNGDSVTTVLKGIDLHVEKNQFMMIVGRSGAGKSTLMYQLGLLDHPTSGRLVVDGVDTGKLSSQERTEFRLERLGFVFQDYAVLPELTALENVMVPMMMRGYSQKKARFLSAEALDKVGLTARLNSLPAQMSGGEQQRVSIARAIAHNPKILFADEPTANLDSETAEAVMRTFTNLHCAGQTVVMVTHEKEFMEYGDRIIQLSDGLIVSDKKLSEDCKLTSHPRGLKKADAGNKD